MLAFLRVKNFALIADLQLELSPGLTVLTGETGAGKSLLIQAIALLTGKRQGDTFLRRGETRAVVEGIFTLDPPLKRALDEAGLPTEDATLHVKRVIQKKGPNRAQINDETVTLATLRSLLGNRLQISGQHEFTTLKDPEVQLWMLDAYGGLLGERAAFGEIHARYRRLCDRLSTLEHRREEEAKERELQAFQLREIASAGLSEEEFARLSDEKRVMNHAESLLKNLQAALDALHEREPSALFLVQSAIQRVEEMATVDPRVEEPLKNLKEAEIYLDEATQALQRHGSKIEFDPARLEEVEQRLSTYATLFKKYGGSLTAVLETRHRLEQGLSASEDLEATLETLRKKKGETWRALSAAARALSEKRRNAAADFSKKMTASLKELGMASAVFQVAFTPPDLPASPRERDISETGLDSVAFLFSANRGEPPLPIREIASGGELSRIFLTVKALITGGTDLQAIVFDEADAGIGGRVADIVGRRIAEISKQTQVLCITHLPQIAVYGDHHFLITKSEDGGRTRIGVRLLREEKERIAELARMLGGETITATTRRHARELYQTARAPKGKKP